MNIKERTQKQIDRFANKELSFGCLVISFPPGEYEDKEEAMRLGTICTVLSGDVGYYHGRNYPDWSNSKYMDVHDGLGDVDRIWSKSVEFDKATGKPLKSEFQIVNLGHPVMIGDVLDKCCKDENDSLGLYADQNTLNNLWRRCGFPKSLNEIFSGEILYLNGGVIGPIAGGESIKVKSSEKFKDPNAQALLEFLESIESLEEQK